MALVKGFDVGKLRNVVEEGVNAAKEGLSNVDVGEIAQGVKGAAVSGVAGAAKAIDTMRDRTNSSEELENPSYRELFSLFWYLAGVDGEVTVEERAKIRELAISIDKSYGSYGDELEAECASELEKCAVDFGRNGAAKISAQRLIESVTLNQRDARLLCWNLFAVANSDGLANEEVEFIEYVAKSSGVDEAIFGELRNYSNTIVEIEEEKRFLSASSRSYGEIEPLVNELSKREQAILTAAQALVTDR